MRKLTETESKRLGRNGLFKGLVSLIMLCIIGFFIYIYNIENVKDLVFNPGSFYIGVCAGIGILYVLAWGLESSRTRYGVITIDYILDPGESAKFEDLGIEDLKKETPYERLDAWLKKRFSRRSRKHTDPGAQDNKSISGQDDRQGLG